MKFICRKLAVKSFASMSDVSDAETAPMREGKSARIKISVLDKQRIVDAYENGDDYQKLGQMLGINSKGSIYNIVYRYSKTMKVSTGKIGGYKKLMITEEIGQKLLQFLEDKFSATLVDMQYFLQTTCDIRPSTQTISNYLQGKLIAIKMGQNVEVDRNCDHVKQTRQDYVRRYMEEGWRCSQTIYIDETSFYLWMAKKTEKSIKAQKVSPDHLPCLSLIMAISRTGPLHFSVLEGGVDHEKYQKFICELSLKIPATKHYLIHDNVAIHNDTITTTSAHVMIKLPPYSPFLNPIETVFSQLKSRVRSMMSTTGQFTQLPISQRIQKMEELVEELLADSALHDNIKDHYRHIKKYFSNSILKMDIL